MDKKQKGNNIIKWAYVEAIADLLDKHNLTTLYMDEGFAYDEDMIHFKYEGRRCKLLGVKKPQIDIDGYTMPLLVEWDKKEWELPVGSHLHIDTLRRITNEVYDWLRDGNDDDWDEFEKNLIANNLDTYM